MSRSIHRSRSTICKCPCRSRNRSQRLGQQPQSIRKYTFRKDLNLSRRLKRLGQHRSSHPPTCLGGEPMGRAISFAFSQRSDIRLKSWTAVVGDNPVCIFVYCSLCLRCGADSSGHGHADLPYAVRYRHSGPKRFVCRFGDDRRDTGDSYVCRSAGYLPGAGPGECSCALVACGSGRR